MFLVIRVETIVVDEISVRARSVRVLRRFSTGSDAGAIAKLFLKSETCSCLMDISPYRLAIVLLEIFD